MTVSRQPRNKAKTQRLSLAADLVVGRAVSLGLIV